MARRKPSTPEHIRIKREQELHTFVYEHEDEIRIEQYSQYHFRLFYKGTMLDVWPVSLTFYGKMCGASKHYDNPKELMRYLQNGIIKPVSSRGKDTVAVR